MTGRLRRSVVPILAGLLLVVVLFVGVFPTRTFFAQREAMAESRSHLAELEAANAELEAEVEALESPEQVEHLARRDFGMVRVGEEPYRILPAPEAPVPVPEAWPFGGLADLLAH